MAGHRRWSLFQPLLHTGCLVIISYLCEPVLPIQIAEICYDNAIHCEPSECGELPHQLKPTVNCRCDRRCSLYNDCCEDYFDHCVKNDTKSPITSSKYSPFFECVSTSETNLADTFVVVGRCPSYWPDDGVRQNCENKTLARSEMLLSLPVNGPDEVVFKNAYCAVCHRIPDSELEIWSMKVWQCKRSADGEYNYGSCAGYQLQPPASMRDLPHRCQHNYVDTCPPGTPAALVEQCERYTAVVFNVSIDSVFEIVAFKNVYCKYCNDYIVNSSAACFPFPALLNPFQFSTLTFSVAQRAVFSTETSGFFTQEVGTPRHLGNCSELKLYDPFQRRCRNLSCPSEMQLQGDTCVFYEAEGCVQDLLLPDLITRFFDGNFQNQYQITLEQDLASRGNQFYIHADFSIAELLKEFLDRMLYGGHAESLQCNTTTLTLVASSPIATTNESWWPICEGVTVDSVGFNEIYMSNGIYHLNTSGYVYQGMNFMHVTTYSLTANESLSQDSRATLCSPFVNCHVVDFKRNQFVVLGSGEQTLFVHKTLMVSFRREDIWQLPDGTLRMCDFMLGRPLYLTVLSDVTLSCGFFSTASLLLALVIYSLFPALRHRSCKIIINLIVALLVAQVALLLGGRPSLTQLCGVLAAILHFAWLAVFLWLTVVASDLAYSIKSNSPPYQQSESNYKVVKLGVVAWSIPAIFVSVCYLVSRLSEGRAWEWLEYGGAQCWIVDPFHSLLAFGVPVAVLLLINFVLVAVMIRMMSTNESLAAAQQANASKMKLILFIKLFLVIGVAWSTFLADSLLLSDSFQYFADVINALQGALIGMILLLQKDARILVAGKLLCRSRDARPDTAATRSTVALAGMNGADCSGDNDMEGNRSAKPQLDVDVETT